MHGFLVVRVASSSNFIIPRDLAKATRTMRSAPVGMYICGTLYNIQLDMP